MQFSDIVAHAACCRMAPDSSFFLYYDSKKIYVKESSVALSNIAVIHIPNPPTDIIISPNSALLAVYFKDKSTALVYTAKGILLSKIQESQSGMSGILWSPDSLQLLIFSQLLYKLSIYNLTTKTIIMIKSPKLNTSKGCSFSSNGKMMVLIQKHDCKDVIGIYSSMDWTLLNSIAVDSYDLIEIKWDPNDSHFIGWENPINYRLFAFCPFKGIVLRYQPYDYALGIKTAEYSNTSHFVALGSFDQKIRLLNARTWHLIAELDCTNTIIQSDKTKIYKEEECLKPSTQLKLVDRNIYKIPANKVQLTQKSPVQGIGLLEFSHDDAYLACRNDNMPYTVWIWNVSTLELDTVISLSSHVRMLKWDKWQRSLCVVSGTEKVLFWNDGVFLECSFKMDNRKFNIQRFNWSEDRKRMILFDKSELIYADLVPSE